MTIRVPTRASELLASGPTPGSASGSRPPGDLAGEPRFDPLALIMLGARTRGGDPQVGELLRQLGSCPLRIHPMATPERLGLDAAERELVAELRARPQSFPRLLASKVADAPVARATVYALLITRCVDLGGTNRPPVGLRGR